MNDFTLQTVIDRMKISDLVYLYKKGLDSRDFALVKSTLTTPFTLIGKYTDDRYDDGEIIELTPDEWIEMGPSIIQGFDATSHLSANHLITINGDNAHIETTTYVSHYLYPTEEEQKELGTTKTNIFCNDHIFTNYWLKRQPDGGWLINKVRSRIIAHEGEPRAFDLCLKRQGVDPSIFNHKS